MERMEAMHGAHDAAGRRVASGSVRRGGRGGLGGCLGALAALCSLACLAGVGGSGMELGEMTHVSYDAGANEWWDAVTGRDEYGDLLTTLMHKRWGTSIQLYHEARNAFLPFRFIPHIGWISDNPKGRAQAVHFYGDGEMHTVDYWFASRHLEELNNAREADSLLPDEMDLGIWKGTQVGEAMVFVNDVVMQSKEDDSFTELRQLVLLEHGFIFLGTSGMSLSVIIDQKGNPEVLAGVRGTMTEGCCFKAFSKDVREQVLPTALGLPLTKLARLQLGFSNAVKAAGVSLRANNPVARMCSPDSYKQEKGKGWVWADKGSGSMLDGANPYCDEVATEVPPAA